MHSAIPSVSEAIELVERIRNWAPQGMDQECHNLEDELMVGVLMAIASGQNLDGAVELAKAALESRNIEFYRRCD